MALPRIVENAIMQAILSVARLQHSIRDCGELFRWNEIGLVSIDGLFGYGCAGEQARPVIGGGSSEISS